MKINNEIYQEIKQQFNKNSEKMKFDNKILLIILGIFWLMLLIPLSIFLCMKSYEHIDSFNNIPEPLQIPTSWWTIIYANWDTVNVNFLAEYDIKWRVLATAQYWDNIFDRALGSSLLEDKTIRYKDVWIWWWFMTQDDYVNRFNRKSSGRWLHPGFTTNENWNYVFSKFSWKEINSNISHNHLIPANNRVKFLLYWIRRWQYIHIKWYLVWMYSDRGYNIVSSLTREDMWDWACETIYVTDVTWLKEKK